MNGLAVCVLATSALLCGCGDKSSTTPPAQLVIPDGAQFTVRGAWDDPHALTVAIDPAGGSMDSAAFKRAANRALKLWSDLGVVTFEPAAEGRVPSFTIGWGFQRGVTLDDGIAQAGPVQAGSWCALDPKLPWENEATVSAALAHEIGHLLGLDHNEDRDSLLFPLAGAANRRLGLLDRNGVHSLYGGGGPDEPGDIVILWESGRASANLRGVSPIGKTELLVCDLNGDGADEILVWLTDVKLHGSTRVYRFAPGIDGVTFNGGTSGGPRLARTDGPVFALVGRGEVRADVGLDGERVLLTLYPNDRYRALVLSDMGRPSSAGLAAPVQLISGAIDEDGDGTLEVQPDPLPPIPPHPLLRADGDEWLLELDDRTLRCDRVQVGDLDGDMRQEWIVRVKGIEAQ